LLFWEGILGLPRRHLCALVAWPKIM
jgi:hypothetical protein